MRKLNASNGKNRQKRKEQKTEINSDNDSTMQAWRCRAIQQPFFIAVWQWTGERKAIDKAERQITGDTLVKIETRMRINVRKREGFSARGNLC
ncbi:hypothetical protein [Escherichia coli]|uniref:hypothetical protein n=1 Tax=Escherichia coli TaxID=562 RepID=UPI0020262EFE|nr:hypothetical protein [Escherichia coli]